jgi:hypothetical protein
VTIDWEDGFAKFYFSTDYWNALAEAESGQDAAETL